MAVEIQLPELSGSVESWGGYKAEVEKIRERLDPDGKSATTVIDVEDVSDLHARLRTKLDEYNLLMWRGVQRCDRDLKCAEICNLVLEANLEVGTVDSPPSTADIVFVLERAFLVIRDRAAACGVYPAAQVNNVLSYLLRCIQHQRQVDVKISN